LGLSSTPGNSCRCFGLAVKHFRLAKELTQEDLAYLSGLHATAISNLESGNRAPRFSTVWCVAKALEIPRWQLHWMGELLEQDQGESDERDPEGGTESESVGA
jgi:transcriptional regulator with XRE-family HTH domain